MFHVGRYDPRVDERKQRTRKKEEKTGVKRDAVKSHAKQKKRRRRQEHLCSEASIKEYRGTEEEANLKGGDDIQNGSIDTPQKGMNTTASHAGRDDESDSSSSVPSSSDDESVDSKPMARIRKSIRVIAPEQKPTSSSPMKFAATDEAFDDFDQEGDLVEGSRFTSDNGEQPPEASPVSEEVATALRMSSLPIREAAAAWDLAPFLVENLEHDGYKQFFPIQSLVIPDVIASERHAHIRARDVCVAAPTGSGKTLAFVLPVLNALSKRKIRRLRALVVLPSRDLATQVYRVFERYTRGSDLRVGLAIGQSDFAAEQEALVVGPPNLSQVDEMDQARQRLFFHRGNTKLGLEAFPGTSDAEAPSLDGCSSIPKGGTSALDVLVATPGRLVDHLDKTPGFTLQHLRFLVIDEADRLVNQSYHNWIGRVVGAANSASVGAWNDMEMTKHTATEQAVRALEVSPDGVSFVIDPITWRRGGAGGDDSAFSTNDAYSSVVATVCRPVQLRKLLYSATLTKDPQKLASLGLVNAKHFDAHHLHLTSQTSERRGLQRYSMPPGLSEYTVECTAEQKPLVLLALLLEQTQRSAPEKGIVVVFTSSLDSTHRLVRLLQLLWASAGYGSPKSIAEFSSALSQKQRSSLMRRCSASDGGVSVVVCSDGMSRGMDIPSVSAVVNYDVPSFAKTYVHRCGRTARAGREGTAISLLKGGQVNQFQRMRHLIDVPGRVSALGVRKELVRSAVPLYQSCIKMLRNVIEAEKEGELDTIAVVPTDWLPA